MPTRLEQQWKGPVKIVTPHANDFIFPAIKPILDRHNRRGDPAQTLHEWADPLQAYALSASPTWFFDGYTSPAVHLLTRHNCFIKVQLQLVFGLRSEDEAGSLVVLNGDHWELLEEWLKTLAPSDFALGRGGYKLQWQWWQTNRKPFRFLDLEPEIRDNIMLHAIGPRVTIKESYEWKECGDGKRDDNGDDSDTDDDNHILYHSWSLVEDKRKSSVYGAAPIYVSPPDTALFHVNKLLRDSARDVLWKSTTKVFNSLHYFNSDALRNSRFAGFLRHIELSLSHRGYIDLFKVSIPPFNERERRPHAGCLKTLPNVRSLTLFFHPSTAKTPSPWYNEWQTSQWPCQKVMVEWIMAFAYDDICHIASVKLTGLVKTTTRKRWEDILNDKFTSAQEHNISIDVWKARILNLHPSFFPPQCHCDPFCDPISTLTFRCPRCSQRTFERYGCVRHTEEWCYVDDYRFGYDDDRWAEGKIKELDDAATDE